MRCWFWLRNLLVTAISVQYHTTCPNSWGSICLWILGRLDFKNEAASHDLVLRSASSLCCRVLTWQLKNQRTWQGQLQSGYLSACKLIMYGHKWNSQLIQAFFLAGDWSTECEHSFNDSSQSVKVSQPHFLAKFSESPQGKSVLFGQKVSKTTVCDQWNHQHPTHSRGEDIKTHHS